MIGAAIVLAGFQRWISIGAGCVVLLASFTSFHARWGGPAGKTVLALKIKFGRLLRNRNRSLGAATLLGGLNGLLPCGLVYIACAAAATTGTLSGGILTMLAFGLETAPMLLSIGLAGKALRWNNPLRLRRVVSVCATVAGVLLIVRGLSLGVPYLSPHFSNGQTTDCGCHHAL